MLKNLLLINTALHILFLSDTHSDRVHDKRIADITPYPLPAGSQLLQDLGFQAFMLDAMEIGCALHNFRVRLTPSWMLMV